MYTDEQKKEIYDMAMADIAVRKTTGRGGIELEDWMAIQQCRNLKEAQMMLIYRKKVRAQEDEQLAAATTVTPPTGCIP